MKLISKLTKYREKYGFMHALTSYIGRHNFFFWQCIGSIVTRPYIKKYMQKESVKIINLGGGGNCIEGTLTVDISPRADAYVNITKELPFKTSSVDHIFCEEVIEHVDRESGLQLLKECYRILKPSGILRLSTPDLDWFASRVLSGDESPSINDIFYEHSHCFIYSRRILFLHCTSAGFINLKRSTYKSEDSELGYLDSHADRFNHIPEISQYLEMQKPPI